MTEALRPVGPAEARRLNGPLVGGSIRTSGPLRSLQPPLDMPAAEVHDAADSCIQEALALAAEGAAQMGAMPLHRRVAIVERMAAAVEQHRDRLAATMTWQTGKPIRETRREVARAAETLRLAGRAADLLRGRQVLTDTTPGGAPLWAFTHRRPIGVVAAITPANAPLNLLAHKLGPGLVAGNAVIAKPAPATSVVSIQLAEIALEAGAPPEAVQVLTGDGEPARRLAQDPRVGVVSFTGGTVAGRALWQAAPFKRIIMELGGNSANLVLRDADVDRAAAACVRGAFSNSGQSCNSVQRIIVDRHVADAFVERFSRGMAQLRVGDPFDEDTQVAGVSSLDAAQRIETWIAEAVADGARLAVGGKRDATTIWPTLLDDVTPSMRVAREEVFGPVAVILRVDGDEEAIEVANATDSGLQHAVFTSSLDRALACGERLAAGSVIVNRSSNFRLDSFVYGGVKSSGVGREDPASSVLQMSEEHFVVLGDRHGPSLD